VQKNIYILIALLLYGYIFSVMLNYENAWMHPEVAETAQKFFEEHKTTPDRFSQIFNWTLTEGSYQGRLCSRPRFVSHIFYITNLIFRNGLFQYIPPHPSLSLTWIFALFLAPYLLYKLLLNLTKDREVAVLASLAYLTLPGVLVPVMMLFHPAKALSSFFYILCLYLASRIQLKIEEKDLRRFKLDFFVLVMAVATAFFCDEYCLFIFILIPIFFPRIFFGPAKVYVWGLYLWLPIIYYGMVVYGLPAIYAALGYPGFDIFAYLKLDRQAPRFFFDIFYAFVNFILLLHDNLMAGLNVFLKDNSQSLRIVEFLTVGNHVTNPENIRVGWDILNSSDVPAVQAIHSVIVGAALILFLPAAKKVWADSKERQALGYLFKAVVCLMLFAVFFTVLHVTTNVFSGCGWYGSSFSGLFAIFIGIFFAILKKGMPYGKIIILVFTASLCVNTLWNTRLVNFAWFAMHYRGTYWELDIWFNKITRHEIYQKHYRPQAEKNFELTYRAWRHRYNPPVAQHFLEQAPLDVKFYLRAELPYVKTEGL